ncbi:MAG: lipid II flippase MurJ, partial [Pseudomonadota bacterium]|nr:lipid II flippase MurJ [Pseudomonadota bacterium]
MNLTRAIATVGGLTVVSRVTGFLRDVSIAALLGAGPIADAFFVAFKLPNFFRRLTGEGALTVAFVPLFAGRLEQEGKAAARRFASEVAALLGVALIALTLTAQLTMPWLVSVMAPGFTATPERFALTVELTRVTFLYLPLISLVALLGGMLNAVGRFAVMAASPILLNLVLIS